MDLMASRQVGMGLGPIWWNTVEDYGRRKGLEEDQMEALHFHVKKMDEAYLKKMTKD